MHQRYKMSETVNRVRSKAVAPASRSFRWLWITLALIVAVGVAGTVAFKLLTGNSGLFGGDLVVVSNGAGRIIKVPPGGSVQSAVDQALSGDIVELQAGATYTGEVKLPNKLLTDFVTIRSSAADRLPVDKRVGPADSASMAKILAGSEGKPAISAENGAHHYRIVGIEFTATGKDYVYNLVLFGNGEVPAKLPHDIEFDRSYLHPGKTGVIRRGIALNSAATTIKNSYIEGFAFPSEETQGICGWTGTRNVHILNNYIEGGAENIMFGGSDPATADQIPTDIEVRGNHLNKPKTWVGKATMKTLFELKNAKKVELVGNLLSNNWVGSAFRITIRNQDGKAPFSTVEDVVIRDNVIKNSGDGMNILGKDDTHPSQTLRSLTIENNLFLNIAGGNGFDGSGYLIQIAEGNGVTIANNTALNSGNVITFYGTVPQNFVFRDNIVGHGNYGIHGLPDLASPAARSMFQNNLFVNLNRVPSGDYAFPSGNSIVQSLADIGFVNPQVGDYRLLPNSKFRGKGRGGKNVGSDLAPKPEQLED